MPSEQPNFWTSLSGLLTALAGLLTAIGGFWVVVSGTRDHPPSPPASASGAPAPASALVPAGTAVSLPAQVPTVTPAFKLAEFKHKTIVEGTTYTIRDDSVALTLVAMEVRAKRRQLSLGLGLSAQMTPTVITLVEGKAKMVVLNGREFVLEVHDFIDLKNRDQAVISLLAK